jgi:hypothetical protein
MPSLGTQGTFTQTFALVKQKKTVLETYLFRSRCDPL